MPSDDSEAGLPNGAVDAPRPLSPPMDEAPTSSQFSTPEQERLRKKFKPLSLPTRENMEQADLMDNCIVKTVIAGTMGGLFGIAFGMFTSSLDNAGGGPMGLAPPPEEVAKPTRVVVREMLVNMKDKSLSYAKGFAKVGALYSMSECVIEKQRGKHDKWNPALAGCATGGALAVSGGVKATCIGCASFAAFSVAIEYFLDQH